VTEAGTLREFLSDVAWGDLDYLLVDVPPGTDKIGRFLDLVPKPDQVLLVTIPSEVARSVVARSASLLRDAGVACAGIVGNMTGYSPARSEGALPLFGGESVGALSSTTGLEVWAEIPFDPELGAATDRGEPPGTGHPTSAASGLEALARRVERGPKGRKAAP
jgi:ATP-binding protein involved in chromosome partitioning